MKLLDYILNTVYRSNITAHQNVLQRLSLLQPTYLICTVISNKINQICVCLYVDHLKM